MKSLLLPSPLHDPDQSLPSVVADDIFLLPLDVATVSGGRLRATFMEIAERKQNFWYLPANFLRATSDLNRDLRRTAILEWLKIGGDRSVERRDVFTDDPSYVQNTMGLRGLRRANVAAPNVFDWAKEIFPTVVLRAGELKLRDDLTTYGREVPDYAVFPWEGLRFFAGFLRRHDVRLADDAALDWARLSALYSPQDEVSESETLQSNEVILNPTIQFHRGPTQLLAVGRFATAKIEKALDKWDALLLDEVMEAPRRLSQVTLRNCEAEHPRGGTAFKEAFKRLVSDRILLQGEGSR